jgi:hypothetical protein
MTECGWGLHTTRTAHANAGAGFCGPAVWLLGLAIRVGIARGGLRARRAGRGPASTVCRASGASAGKSGDTGGVAGMRITLSGAMRARDVSRPTDEQVAAAAEREAMVARVGRPGGAGRARGPASATSGVAGLGGATSAGTTSDSPAPGGAAPGGAAAGRSPSGSAAAGSPTAGSPAPDSSTAGSSARTAPDESNGPTRGTHGWDNGRADRRDAVAPAPAAGDAPSPTRRRRRRAR